jgi:hypothetical protein
MDPSGLRILFPWVICNYYILCYPSGALAEAQAQAALGGGQLVWHSGAPAALLGPQPGAQRLTRCCCCCCCTMATYPRAATLHITRMHKAAQQHSSWGPHLRLAVVQLLLSGHEALRVWPHLRHLVKVPAAGAGRVVSAPNHACTHAYANTYTRHIRLLLMHSLLSLLLQCWQLTMGTDGSTASSMPTSCRACSAAAGLAPAHL